MTLQLPYGFVSPPMPTAAVARGWRLDVWQSLNTMEREAVLADCRAEAGKMRIQRRAHLVYKSLGAGTTTTGGQATPLTPQEIDAALRGLNPMGQPLTVSDVAAVQAQVDTTTTPVDLPQSNFYAAGKRAWWTQRASDGTRVCAARGGGVLSTLQAIMRDALRGPWSSYDGSHAKRPGVDGNFGPETGAALYAYAKKAGYPAAALATVQTDLRAKRITPAVMLCVLWCAYYTPRLFDQDVGGKREVKTDPALLGSFAPSTITIPPNAELWKWLSRPAVEGDAISQQTELPACKLQGAEWSLGQAVLPPDMPGDLARVPLSPIIPTGAGGSSSSGSSGLLLAAAVVVAAVVATQ